MPLSQPSIKPQVTNFIKFFTYGYEINFVPQPAGQLTSHNLKNIRIIGKVSLNDTNPMPDAIADFDFEQKEEPILLRLELENIPRLTSLTRFTPQVTDFLQIYSFPNNGYLIKFFPEGLLKDYEAYNVPIFGKVLINDQSRKQNAIAVFQFSSQTGEPVKEPKLLNLKLI